MTIRKRYSRYLLEGSTPEWIQALVLKTVVEVLAGLALGVGIAAGSRRYIDSINVLATKYGGLGELAFETTVILGSVYTLTLCTYINVDIAAAGEDAPSSSDNGPDARGE